MNLKKFIRYPDLSRLRVLLLFKRDAITSAWKVSLHSQLSKNTIRNKMKWTIVRFFFARRTRKNRNFLDYHHNVDDHIQIVSHDRDSNNVDVHEQAMLSTKTEESPTEKHAESKMLVRCLLGNAWLVHFLMTHRVSRYSIEPGYLE